MGEQKDPRELIQPVLALRQQAGELVIADKTEYATVAANLRGVAGTLRDWKEYWAPLKKSSHDAWKNIVAKEKEGITVCESVKRELSLALKGYDDKIEAARRAEQERLQKIADERARKERERAEAAAEKQRKIEEEARQEAERKLEAARAAEDEKEQQRLAQEAEKDLQRAERASEKADEKEQKAEDSVAPVVHVEAEGAVKAEGVSKATRWVVDSVDKDALIEAAATRPDLRAYLTVDETALRRVAQALKGDLNIPGVRVKQVTDVRVKA